MSELKLSNYINPSFENISPWVSSNNYLTDQFVFSNDIILKCKASHTSNSTSIIADIQSGKWIPQSPFPMTKAQREAITSPFENLRIHQTDTPIFDYVYQNSQWIAINPIIDKSLSGYVDVGSMRIQWGTGGAGSVYPVISFPASFKDTNYSFTCNIIGGADYLWGASIMPSTKTVSGVTINKRFHNASGVGGSSGEPVDWMAIGLKP